MDSKFKRIVFSCLFIFVLCLLGLGIYWLKPSSAHEKMNSHHTVSSPPLSVTEPATAFNKDNTKPAQWISSSQQDTAINCQLQLNAQGQLIVNEQVKNCFEYFITQYGEKPLTQIKADFIQYIQASYKSPAQEKIIDLWTRYLDYRAALAELTAPAASQESVAYFQSIYQQTQNLRQKYFSRDEIQGLFGTEDSYHHYTLSRLAILENKKLNAAEKAKQLHALFQSLPQDWQENLEQIATLDNLRQLTSEIKTRQGSAEELRQMRLNLVGIDATERLERLDQQRQSWQNRSTQYLAQREQILKSGLSDLAKQQSIQNLREHTFQQQQERLRIQTFEQIQDQGGKLPFND